VFYGLGQIHINLDSFTAAVIGLGIAEAAYVAEYYRAGFLTVTQGQREAGLSLGLSKFGVMRLIVIPEAIPFLVPPLLNSFVGLMKAATIAAAIGAPEVLYEARNYMAITGRVGEVALIIIVLYCVATIPLTRLIAGVERGIRAPYAAVR
jgi:polar amino acid transport system permease protein